MYTQEEHQGKSATADETNRQYSGGIPDMLTFFDHYEFGMAEVSNKEADVTKELHDGALARKDDAGKPLQLLPACPTRLENNWNVLLR